MSRGGLYSFYAEDKASSVQENRVLAQFNSPNLKNLIDGSWFQEFEEYNKDQFILREKFVETYYFILDKLNVRERNGFVKGLDNSILPVNSFYISKKDKEKAENYGIQQVDAMLAIANAANDYGGKVIYLNAPDKKEFSTNMYPKNYNSFEEIYNIRRDSIITKAKEAGITVVETYEILKSHEDEYVFYKTDHHWTIRGAYYAYKALLECINQFEENNKLEYPDYSELDVYINDNRMVGSYLKTWGDSGLIDVDYMEYAIPYDMPEYIRYDNGELSKKALFNKKRTDYSSFMGGNVANTVVETGRSELPTIFYIGLSYSNPLEMMSIYNFETVYSIEPRDWKGSICDYVKEIKPDYIVILRDDIYEGHKAFSCVVE